jgi:hypothetical protein
VQVAKELPYPVTSARFINISQGKAGIKIYCWGEKESLKIKSNPRKDSKIIKRFFKSMMQ